MTRCEFCTRPLYGREQEPTEDGKLLHWSCRELLQRDAKNGEPRLFEVEVRVSGTTTVLVAARSEDEALELIADGDLEIDVDVVDLHIEAEEAEEQDKDPSAWQLQQHRCAIEKRDQRMQAHYRRIKERQLQQLRPSGNASA